MRSLFFGPSVEGGGTPQAFILFFVISFGPSAGVTPQCTFLWYACVSVFIFYFWCNLGKALRAVTRGTCQRPRRLAGGDPSPGWLPEVRDLGTDLFFNYF